MREGRKGEGRERRGGGSEVTLLCGSKHFYLKSHRYSHAQNFTLTLWAWPKLK